MVSFIAYITEEDMDRWTSQNRQDILDTIQKGHVFWMGDRLVSRTSGQTLQQCPFLTRHKDLYSCTIHETRPVVCQNFTPGSSEICSLFGKHTSDSIPEANTNKTAVFHATANGNQKPAPMGKGTQK